MSTGHVSFDPDEVEVYRELGLEPVPQSDTELCVQDFYAFLPGHNYIFVPTREPWPAVSVNSRVRSPEKKVTTSAWLDRNRAVEQMTWVPGEPMIIEDRLISQDGGWIERAGCRTFNLYRAPDPVSGDAQQAQPWLAHVAKLYPDDGGHIIRWLAQRVQQPGRKINHALVLGGKQGIGKDSLIEGVKLAVGAHNITEVSPSHLLGRFNGFAKSVILRVSEARDLGDVNRFAFYDHIKVYTAAPPDVLRCDEKNLREYSVPNVCGLVVTTNHKTDGIYLPADDRRHFVAWSDLTPADFEAGYWRRLYGWYNGGGYGHVAAYLARLDLRDWDEKAPPPKTPAFWAIVDASRAPEDAELADVLERLQFPDVTTLVELAEVSPNGLGEFLRDRRNARQVPHRLESAGYVPVRNDYASDGLWKYGGKRQVVYAKAGLNLRDRVTAVQRLIEAAR